MIGQATTASATYAKRLAIIKALMDSGYTLIPLRGKKPCCKPGCPSMHPVGIDPKTGQKTWCGSDWPDTPPGKWTAEELAAGGNYGVALKAGDLVVDVDPRNFALGDDPLKRLQAVVGPLGGFVVRTGGGGFHIYLRKPADILVRNDLKDYPGIEFKSLGRQVVGPGSIHPETGNEYEIVEAGEELPAPQALLDLIQRVDLPFEDCKGTGTYVNDADTQGRFVHYLQDIAEPSIEGKAGDHNAFKVACKGRDLGLPPEITWELMLDVWNDRCSPPWDAEELRVKVAHAYKYARGTVGANHPTAVFTPISNAEGTTNGKATPDSSEPAFEEDWTTTPQGKIIKCFKNLMLYLRCPRYGLAGLFAANDFTGRVEFTRPAPWHKGNASRVHTSVSDDDLNLLKGYLATRMSYDAGIKDIESAITNVANEASFHPVRDYLDALVWDGKPRLDTWLQDYLGVQNSAYVRACSRKTLCAAVRRVFCPGIKFDSCLILEGEQDIGKSTVVEILAGQWAAEAPVDPHSRDTVDMMQGRWIIELAEMEVARRADQEALKAFISRRKDLARLAYGRKTCEFPRQSIFIATKNPQADGVYLSDDTGNRRWWPVYCDPKHGLNQVDFKGLAAARDQLFAEAVARAPKEKLYMETNELKAAAKGEAALRHAEHEWTERIAAWLHENPTKEFVSSREVWLDAMRGEDKSLDAKSCRSIAQCMRNLNWRVGHHRINGRLTRGYVKRNLILEALDSIA
jgi:predicted P-loop ATPase